MEGLRLASELVGSELVPCSLCSTPGRYWDRIANKPYCPGCEEALILGQAGAVIERTEKHWCLVCRHAGTVRYLTFPLRASVPIELDLCPHHLRSLLGRRLERRAFRQIQRKLARLGLGVALIFLLHDAFYDRNGQALQPAAEAD